MDDEIVIYIYIFFSIFILPGIIIGILNFLTYKKEYKEDYKAVYQREYNKINQRLLNLEDVPDYDDKINAKQLDDLLILASSKIDEMEFYIYGISSIFLRSSYYVILATKDDKTVTGFKIKLFSRRKAYKIIENFMNDGNSVYQNTINKFV